MHKSIQLIVIPLLLTFPSINIQSKEINLNELLDLLYNYQFEKIDTELNNLIYLYPDSIEYFFLEATVNWWKISSDPFNEDFKKKFLSFSQHGIEVASSQKELTDFEYLILGGIYGYLGRYYLLENKWISAYKYGKKGKKYLQHINMGNPLYSETQYGLGLYDYYAGMLPSYLKIFTFLIGLHGSKKQGLEKLQIATQQSNLSNVEAKYSLCLIYIYYEKEYDKAIKILQELTSQFPINIQFKRLLIEAWHKKGNYEKSISICMEIIKNPNSVFVSNNEKSEILSTIGFLYQKNENYEIALYYYALSEEEITNKNFFILSPWKYYNIAYCYQKENEIQKALAYYNKVLNCEDAFGYHKRAEEKIAQLIDR